MQRAVKSRGGKERRTARRYVLALPVKVGGPTHQPWDGVAKDVSVNGLYLIIKTDEILPLGSMIDFSMVLPVEVTGKHQIRVSGRAKTVRVEKQTGEEIGSLGIASTIESYDFVRFEDTTPERQTAPVA
jgi:hypothetical protein